MTPERGLRSMRIELAILLLITLGAMLLQVAWAFNVVLVVHAIIWTMMLKEISEDLRDIARDKLQPPEEVRMTKR